MGQPLPLLLVGFVDDFFMFCLIGEICGIQIAQRPIYLCKFIGIDGLYLYLDKSYYMGLYFLCFHG